ncbi:MAG TPA: DUF6292 family protein [Streptosporangiaceae bacterium]|nr:DUF6292 family protein [Streptosporangiaceae bacterium]
MNQSHPDPHFDPWVNLLQGYITALSAALAGQGARIERSWLDPRDPRDATITYSSAATPGELRALVWDEVTGCRTGRFVSGRQGVRTELTDAVYLGGGVLVEPREVAARLATGVTAPRRTFRSYDDVRDGLDDALRRYAG